MKYKPMNEQMSCKFHIFLQICMSNVFSIHNINVWNIQIMNEQILQNFDY